MKRITLLFITLLLWASAKAQSPVNSVGSGCSLDFDGVNDYVNCGDINIPPFDGSSQEMTVEAWVNTRNFLSPYSSIVSKYHTATNGQATFSFYISSSGNLGLSVYVNSSGIPNGWLNAQALSVLPLNEYVHVSAGVNLNTQTIRLYINGVEQAVNYNNQPPLPTTIPNRGEPLYIGRLVVATGSSRNFDGQIDEIRVWNYIRTEAEIRRDMCRRLTGTEPGLVGYWRFDDCGGNVAMDSSPNGNHGTLY